MTPHLSHVKKDGSISMVDVTPKSVTARVAVAEAQVRMKPAAVRQIRSGVAKKGDVLVVAQIAGILAAKNTAHIIPLCHPVGLTHVDVVCAIEGSNRVRIQCTASCTGQTGVEMEALTGAAVAALTVYDMCKAADRAMSIERIELIEKSGGKSGRFQRKARG